MKEKTEQEPEFAAKAEQDTRQLFWKGSILGTLTDLSRAFPAFPVFGFIASEKQVRYFSSEWKSL